MKILYFISVHGHGRGGHFHSLNHISKKIGEQNQAKIITFGPGKSNIIESNPYFIKHIDFKGFNLIHLKREINKIILEFKPDIYHCFDEGSYNVVRLLISSLNNKIVINKCGGPNPKRFAKIHNLILFSRENLDWFNTNKKYRDSNILLIPNRVKALMPDNNFQLVSKEFDKFVFLRICRINQTYKKSIFDSIQLIENLLLKEINNVKLLIIGTVEDKKLYENLTEHPLIKSQHLFFLTDTSITSEASKLLYLADAVIGTGRGLMESASLAIPVLAINANGNIPVLLDNKNFSNAFKTNFSERNIFPDYVQEENLQNIIRLIQDKDYYTKMSTFSKDIFEQYFDLDKVAEAYSNVYSKALYGKRNLRIDALLILRSMINFFRSYLFLK